MEKYKLVSLNIKYLILVFMTLAVPSYALNIKKYVLSTHNLDDLNDRYSKKDLTNENIDSDLDVGFLLTKLSDEEIIQLLRDEPIQVENIEKMASLVNYKSQTNRHLESNENNKPQAAYFRLEDKNVDPYSVSNKFVEDDNAERHLKNILYSHPNEKFNEENDDDKERKKEKLFDELVSQLKSLCSRGVSKMHLDNLPSQDFINHQKIKEDVHEHMFLVLNDEIHSESQDDIITVDPNSLSDNSSILLLGPIKKPMSDVELIRVMKRIENVLFKDYIPFLSELAKGAYNKNDSATKNFLFGSSRRYIKPHRCNHQSKLTRVYGGPKWLICTGYININKPSLYD